jgi:glyoxylase-like metal-dependent hydrolase (beta-lactamase superfamily II)
MEIAPGIRRLGSGLVNSYLLEEQGGVTIVDAGAPGYWNALPAELAAMGRTLDDVRAVVLTHAHTDHIGFAERIRKERGTRVLVHADDVPLTRAPSYPKFNGTIRPLPVLRFLAFAITHGMARIPPILEVGTFADGEVLDVPGRPRVIHVPGHSEGSAALHLRDRDAIFIGDAFVTLDVMSGAKGPRLSPFNANWVRAFESLTRLDGVDARLVLPGHGAPWPGGMAAALAEVRRHVHVIART